jgi:hypothetical protein
MLLALLGVGDQRATIGREEACVTVHGRHSVTERRGKRGSDPAKARQGAYGSGGSYGVGGAFADDEPGAKTEQMRDVPGPESVPDAPEPVPDIHTRDSELNDESLREVRRTDKERRGSDSTPAENPSTVARKRWVPPLKRRACE